MAESTEYTTPKKATVHDQDDPPPTAEQTRFNLLKQSTLAVGNFAFTVPTEAKTPVTVTGALFQKEHRPSAGSDEERHLILAICTDLI